MRWNDSTQEATGLGLQELSRAAEDRTMCTSSFIQSPGVRADSGAHNTHSLFFGLQPKLVMPSHNS